MHQKHAILTQNTNRLVFLDSVIALWNRESLSN